MKIFRFTLPQKDNQGQDMTDALKLFQARVFDVAGGFTMSAQTLGYWRDERGVTFQDASWNLEVALETSDLLDGLLDALKALWPDQLAFYVAMIGQAEFIPGLGAQAAIAKTLSLPIAGAGQEWTDALA